MGEEYYGWISIQEKLPKENEKVLIAYDDGNDVEILISRYSEHKLGGTFTLGMRWSLPEYYSQNRVVAWRILPPYIR